MREIKFRCWNKETKSFHYWGVDIEGCTFIGPLSGKQPANKYEHQQFTGLRDQNGKEIYEGDIVQGDTGYIGEILWDDKYATWRNVYRKGPSVLCRNMPFPLWQAFHAEGSLELKPTIEVIGNIYENPELLEVPHDTKI